MENESGTRGSSFSFSLRRRDADGAKGMPWAKDVPEGALGAVRARNLEKLFLDRTKDNLIKAGELESPLDKKTYPVSFSEKSWFAFSDKSQIKAIMEHYEIYDKSLLRKIPQNARFEYTIESRSLFSKKPAIKVVGVFLTHLEGLITKGCAALKVPLEELHALREKYAADSKIFVYIGVFSPTGFEADCYADAPDGAAWEFVLIEPAGGTGYRLTCREEKLAAIAHKLFDLETPEEKIYRVQKYVKESDDLGIPGGFLVLADAADDLNLPAALLGEVFREVAKEDDSLTFETVGGKDIIKRARI
jgi:hypothetical protein